MSTTGVPSIASVGPTRSVVPATSRTVTRVEPDRVRTDFGNALWVLRRWLDQCFGRVGMTRGRRRPDTCAVGDTIDGWTVDEYVIDRRLRLRADFLLPGRGWLDFEVSPADGGRRSIIRQAATFDPGGAGGLLYWYAVLPLHSLMSGRMLAQIARRAEALESAWRGRDAG